MSGEDSAPELLTALLEHARTLLHADHAIFSEWDEEADTVTLLAASGVLAVPEVVEVGRGYPLSDYVEDDDDPVRMAAPLEPVFRRANDPSFREPSQAYMRRLGVASEVFVQVPSRPRSRWEMEIFYLDPAVEIDERDLATVRDLGRLASSVIESEKRATALRLSEERYRTLNEQLPAIVYVSDPELGSTIPNPDGIRRLLGYEPGKWSSDPERFWADVLHPDDRDRVLTWAADMDPTPPFTIEYRLRKADGTMIWVRDAAVPVFRDDGSLDFWQGLIVDITSLVEADQAMRASELRYRTLAQQLPAWVYEIGADNSATLHNPGAFPNVVGMDEWADDTFGAWRDAVHPDDRERVLADWDRVRAAGGAWFNEYRILGRDGSVLWVRDSGVPVVSAQTGDVVWHGLIFDVTDLVESADAVRAAEARYRNLVEQIPLVTYIDDPEGLGVYVSPQIEELLEIPVEQWVGTYTVWLERIHPDDRDRADWEFRRMLDGGDAFDLEYRVVRRDGSVRWMHDQGRRLTEPEALAGYIQGVIFDVTDRRRLEEATEQRARRQRVLAELGLRALAGIDRDELMADAAEAAVEVLEMWGGGILELQGDDLVMVAAAGRAAPGIGTRVGAGAATAAGYTLLTDAPVISNELATEARFALLGQARTAGLTGVLSVKIAGSPSPYGALQVYRTDGRPFGDDESDFLQSVANVLAAAVERDRAQAALALSEASRQHVLAELLRSADAERARIATELHDDTIQVMTAALFALDRQDGARRRGDDAAAADAARVVRSSLADAVERTRRLTFELRPPLLQARGLEAAVSELLDETSRSGDLVATLDASVGRHSAEVESLCYRTVQELVSNARRHSRASHLQTTLVETDGQLCVEVSDDGVGFAVERALDRSTMRLHLGLDSAAERVRLAGGTFAIESTAGSGTVVRFTLPLRLAQD